VLIGPADIRFELWFDDQKLSRDESIKVEWIPAQMPQMAEMPAAGNEPIEMSNTPPTPTGGAPAGGAGSSCGVPNGRPIKTGSFTVVNKRANSEIDDRKPRRAGGLFKKSSFFGRAA
jgi:hypothetical protein